jgi:hypothetical protein
MQVHAMNPNDVTSDEGIYPVETTPALWIGRNVLYEVSGSWLP